MSKHPRRRTVTVRIPVEDCTVSPAFGCPATIDCTLVVVCQCEWVSYDRDAGITSEGWSPTVTSLVLDDVVLSVDRLWSGEFAEVAPATLTALLAQLGQRWPGDGTWTCTREDAVLRLIAAEYSEAIEDAGEDAAADADASAEDARDYARLCDSRGK